MGAYGQARRAVEIGLVDELGGLENALDYVATLAEVENRNDLNVIVYPKPKTAIEQIVQFLDQQGGAVKGANATAQLMERATPYLEMLNVIEKPQNYSVYESIRVE